MTPRKGKTASDVAVQGIASDHRGTALDIAPAFFELQVWLSPVSGSENVFDLYATVRVKSAELLLEGESIEVRAQQATLAFRIDGLEEDLFVTRFGDIQLEAEHRTQMTTNVTTEGTVAGRSDAKIGLTPVGPLASASLEGSVKGQRSIKTIEKGRAEAVARRVIARPNCMWDLVEPNGSPLDGTYLMATKLCTLRRKSGSNRISVVGRLLVRQRDLKFIHEDGGWVQSLMRTKRRLLDLFLTRIVAGDETHRGAGVVFFSTSEIEL